MTTETPLVSENQETETSTKTRRAAQSEKAKGRPERKTATANKSRSRRRKADHRPLKVMLTTGAFLATWMGTSWVAQQDAIAAAAIAQANQPEPVTITYVAQDGTLSERTLDLQPVPQVVVTSTSSK